MIPLGEPFSQDVILIYPKGTSSEVTIDGANSVYVQLQIYASQIVAERVPVTLRYMVGTAGWQIAKNLTSIDISFDGAHYCPNGIPFTPIGPNAAGRTLMPTGSPPKRLNLWLTKYHIANDVVICWLKTGDYTPTLTVNFGTKDYPIKTWRSQDYPEYSIHVEPAIVTEELKANRNMR